MRLGLFLRAAHWSLLKKHKWPLVKADQLDDPFLNAQQGSDSEVSGVLSDEEYQTLLAKQYQALPEHLRSMINFEYFFQQAQAKREDIESSHCAKQSWPQIDKKRYSSLGILRLHEFEAIGAMHWSLLGQGHRGMLWVFDINEANIASWLGEQPYKWGKVEYKKHRPKQDPGLSFSHVFFQHPSFSMLKEWRLVLPWSLAREGISIPLSTLKEVYFGALFDQALLHEIHRYSYFDRFYRSLDYHQIGVKRERFELTTKPLCEPLMATAP